MSLDNNSRSMLFNSLLMRAAFSIWSDVSRPVILAFGLWAVMHSDTPPLPMPTSNTVFAFVGAKAANQTASDVGL